MSQSFAVLLLAAIGIYAAMGVLFALPFVVWGVNRIDPSAAKGSWGFRVLVLPGTAALWPILLTRWLRKAPPPTERSAHRAERSGVGS